MTDEEWRTGADWRRMIDLSARRGSRDMILAFLRAALECLPQSAGLAFSFLQGHLDERYDEAGRIIRFTEYYGWEVAEGDRELVELWRETARNSFATG
jgi:hypothetical protein